MMKQISEKHRWYQEILQVRTKEETIDHFNLLSDFDPEPHLVSRDVVQQAAPTIVNNSSSSVNELILLDGSLDRDCQ